MAVINPVAKEAVAGDVKPIYDNLTKAFGRVPNIFGVMAQRAEVLKHFLPLYGSIINEGTLEPKYKEFAYLKTSILNGCEY